MTASIIKNQPPKPNLYILPWPLLPFL
jgi:hypothetical protein